MYVVVSARSMRRRVVLGGLTIAVEDSPMTGSVVVFEGVDPSSADMNDAHCNEYRLTAWPPLSAGIDQKTQILLGKEMRPRP